MPFSDSLDQAYSDAPTREEVHAPPGWYLVRVTSVAPKVANTGAHGLHVSLRIAEGPHEGLILQKSFWLNGGALAISKRALDALGFEGMTPSKILAHTAFKDLPAARAYLGYREFEGRPVVELSAFAPAESTSDAGGAK